MNIVLCSYLTNAFSRRRQSREGHYNGRNYQPAQIDRFIRNSALPLEFDTWDVISMYFANWKQEDDQTYNNYNLMAKVLPLESSRINMECMAGI
jgi:hypothetical protein